MGKRNTIEDANTWSQNQIEQVWKKGIKIPHFSPDCWKIDIGGVFIKYSEFGNKNSEFGWEIDPIISVSNGGNDNIENLQPLNWINKLVKDKKMNKKFQSNITNIIINHPLAIAN